MFQRYVLPPSSVSELANGEGGRYVNRTVRYIHGNINKTYHVLLNSVGCQPHPVQYKTIVERVGLCCLLYMY